MILGLAAFIPFLHILRAVASRPNSLVCVPVDTIAFCLPHWQEPQQRLVPKNLDPVSFPAQVKRVHLRIANITRQGTKSLSQSRAGFSGGHRGGGGREGSQGESRDYLVLLGWIPLLNVLDRAHVLEQQHVMETRETSEHDRDCGHESEDDEILELDPPKVNIPPVDKEVDKAGEEGERHVK
jgi:hypothetical protein